MQKRETPKRSEFPTMKRKKNMRMSKNGQRLAKMLRESGHTVRFVVHWPGWGGGWHAFILEKDEDEDPSDPEFKPSNYEELWYLGNDIQAAEDNIINSTIKFIQ